VRGTHSSDDRFCSDSVSFSWIYTLFVALDGNFKQTNFFRKHGWMDLPLLAGLAYMIAPKPFNAWVASHTSDLDVCVLRTGC
jgi:hypothetical protein